MNASTAFLDSAARRHFPCIAGHAGRPTSKDGLRSRPCVALDEELLLGSRRVRLVGVRNRQGCEYTFLFVGSITNADQPLVRVIDLERILIEGGRPHATPEVLVGVSPPFSAHTSEATDIARRLLRGRPDIQPTPAGAWSVHVPRRWSIGPLAGRDVRTEISARGRVWGPHSSGTAGFTSARIPHRQKLGNRSDLCYNVLHAVIGSTRWGPPPTMNRRCYHI